MRLKVNNRRINESKVVVTWKLKENRKGLIRTYKSRTEKTRINAFGIEARENNKWILPKSGRLLEEDLEEMGAFLGTVNYQNGITNIQNISIV